MALREIDALLRNSAAKLHFRDPEAKGILHGEGVATEGMEEGFA